ncbi:MAG: gamma-glutamylcyclotransferase [Pseudomonadota bacterium]
MRSIKRYIFGYGSLVNAKTHNYKETQKARLSGWRRMWRKTDMREAAFLTIVPDLNCELDGLVARVAPEQWEELRERELAYAQLEARSQVTCDLSSDTSLAIFSIEDGKHFMPDDTSPVLLSYIDVVVQGYLEVFGRGGVERFFQTTDGWEAPVRDDRSTPIYRRHQQLDVTQTDIVNAMLRNVGARFV